LYRSPGHRLTLFLLVRLSAAVFAACLMTFIVSPRSAHATVRFDFEQKYFVHPGVQTWDFCLVRDKGIYHLYYTAIPEETPHASNADSLLHATSPDLKHWTLEPPALVVGSGPWDEGALWAPDVFWDDAQGAWTMAYTGADDNFNQRIGLAFSDDLYTWERAGFNPVIEPDPADYIWDPDGSWSDFRDPFIYRQDNQWHILVTAKKWLGQGTGVLYHGVSDDLVSWTDQGPLFANDGSVPGNVLESPQYHQIGDWHHLLFGEYDDQGITILSAQDPADWTMADRVLFDYGYAPEVDEFDPDHRIFSRLANFYLPNGEDLGYVIRLDSLFVDPDGSNPTIHRPSPLDVDWVIHSGVANLGNPIFGDNPLWRGEPSAGLVGNGYYSSTEYYQGPLSGRGSPGTQLGTSVKGVMESRRFVIEGNRMDLLVGGGNYPATCYVALMDSADTTVIFSETGLDDPLMTKRTWDLTDHLGKTCYITIVDNENGPLGFINVDEIVEWQDDTVPVIGVSPGGFSFSIPVNTSDSGVMTIQNLGLAGALDLNWSIIDTTNAIDCPWLSASPTTGTTAQGSSTPVDVQVDATGLAPGLYSCELQVASNDQAKPVISVPVDLEVVNHSEINAIVFDVNSLNGPVSIFSLPNGTGDPLTSAQLWDGVPSSSPIIVDATIGVRLVNGSGAPVVGFPPELITVLAQNGGWVQCPDFPLIADGPTDASGMTTISGALFAGGHSSPGELMQVIVNDPALTSTSYPGDLAGLEYLVNSADIAGDLATGLIDVSNFTGYYYGASADYAADFVWDGLINLNDISKLVVGFGARCPVLPGAVVAQGESSKAQPSEVIGVTFDAAGTSSARMLEPGERIDAYVVLQGPAAERGVEAFDARIRVSDNVTVHLQDLVGEGFNLAADGNFVVGLSEPLRAAASRPVQLVRLRVSVTDDRPAYFWIEPSRDSGQVLPAVVFDGEIHTARPVSGDVSMPVASLNDADFALDGRNTPTPQLTMGIAPNPFNPMTQIRFSVPSSGHVELRIFGTRGQLVTTLRSEVMEAGEHEAVWNGTDQSGRAVSSGVYFSRLQTKSGTLLEKMMLMK